jgi:hypothetical protein
MIHPPLAPFKASDLKLARAKKHLAELEQMVADHLATKPIKHRVRPPQPGMLIAVDTRFQGLPEESGPIIGDCVHNLRSALDLMACDLVRLQGKSAKKVHFPFADSAGELDYQIQKKEFHKAGPEAVALLKEYAPHRNGNVALRGLHDLDVQDKHQTIVPHLMNFRGPAIGMRRVAEDLVSIHIPAKELESSVVDFVFPSDSAFAGKEIVPTLHDLVEMTAGIIEAFKGLASVTEALSKLDRIDVNAAPAHAATPVELRLEVTEHDLTPEELANPLLPPKFDRG